jgi:pimeloyl-[acyl-carrier protein] methyl ester esterase
MNCNRRLVLAGAAAFGLTARTALAQPVAPAIDTRVYKKGSLIVRDRFSVEVVGRGPDLIFVPGLGSSRETWKVTADRLRSRYRLHLFQLAGFAGETSRANATGPFMEPVMEAIDGYIVERKLVRATYIGHSLGGTLGLYLAQRHPEHLKKLCVVDSVPFLAQIMGFSTIEMARQMTDQLRRPLTPQGAAQMEQQITATARAMDTAPADQEKVLGWSRISDGRMVARTYAEDIELDLRAGLPEMKTPTTLIYPRSDEFGVTAAARDASYKAAFAGMAKLTMVPIDGSRHFVMLDQPDKFAAALDAFLKA